jgi:nitroreductase
MAFPRMIPLDFHRRPPQEQVNRAREFYELCSRRRSVRAFSPAPLPPGLLELLIGTAGTAPSGANKQPWKFVVVQDPALKREIRLGAEAEERDNYGHRMTPEWLADLEPLGTDWHKEFLETAPCLIVVFKERYGTEGGSLHKHYYVEESVGIACGLLIAAIHNAGLACLTHTPSPMNFLSRLLNRPANEVPFLLLPVGYPGEDAVVPDIGRKPLPDIMVPAPQTKES